jgi:hypothetical protein
MTFTEWIADVQPRNPPAGAARLGRALRSLHDGLQHFDGDLGGLRDLREDIERLHRRLVWNDFEGCWEIWDLYESQRRARAGGG